MKATTKQRIIDNSKQDKITTIGKYSYYFGFDIMGGFSAIYRREAHRENILIDYGFGLLRESNPWELYDRTTFDKYGNAI